MITILSLSCVCQALHLAASAGFAEGIKMLLAAGAKVTHDSEGLCPLSYAFRSFTGTRQGKTKKKRGSQKVKCTRIEKKIQLLYTVFNMFMVLIFICV